MQISFLPDAGGQLNWLNELEQVFITVNKAASALQGNKRTSKQQLDDGARMLRAWIEARKHFAERPEKKDTTEELKDYRLERSVQLLQTPT